MHKIGRPVDADKVVNLAHSIQNHWGLLIYSNLMVEETFITV